MLGQPLLRHAHKMHRKSIFTHTIHVWYCIFTYISLTFILHSWFLNVGKYTSPMDPMGYEFDYMICQYQNQK